MDLFDAALAAGKVTFCPPAVAAGHKPLKRGKKRKGEQIRPCARCKLSVKYVKGAWAAHAQRRQGWHWVNEDGSHHRCSDFRVTGVTADISVERSGYWDGQWRSAIERDGPVAA